MAIKLLKKDVNMLDGSIVKGLLSFYFPTAKALSLKDAARDDKTPREETVA